MKIYLASSWRNGQQPAMVQALRNLGHEVYDFRNPREGNDGFRWSEIDGGWETWDVRAYLKALSHPIAEAGFGLDWGGMEWADAGLLLLPCGRSAHLEAGYFVGARKPLYIAMAPDRECVPELMYKMADRIFGDIPEALDFFACHR